jgi:hypothetical protein
LNAGTNTCEFFASVGSEDYIDNKMSFRKEDIPNTLGTKTYYPGTNLSNQGALCADAVSCNSEIQRLTDLSITEIQSFTTSEIQACEYCPIRKIDLNTTTVTDELGVSSNDITNLFFRTDGPISHTQITDGGFYVLTPYIPATQSWTHNAFFRKETGSETFKIITGGLSTTVGARSIVPFIPLSKNLKFEYTRVPEVKYSRRIFGGTYDYTKPYSNSYTYTIDPGKFTIIPCDYVDDGFLIQNQSYEFISFNNGTTEAVQTPLKYSDAYNRCIFFIRPSSIGALMTQYPPSGDYFSSGQLAQDNSIYNRINFIRPIDPSYFTDYVTESKFVFTGGMNSNQNNGSYRDIQVPIYYTQLATVDPGLVILI